MAYSNKDFEKNFGKTFFVYPHPIELSEDVERILITPVGFDMVVGFVVPYPNGNNKSPKEKKETDSRVDAGTHYVVPAGGAVVAVTKNFFCFSGMVLGTVHGRSRLSAMGLIINSVSIDPNYRGVIFIYISNPTAHDRVLEYNDPIATLIIREVDTPTNLEVENPNDYSIIKKYEEYLERSDWLELKSYVGDFHIRHQGGGCSEFRVTGIV
jgi:deoxycytidine triphosphate deaminase